MRPARARQDAGCERVGQQLADAAGWLRGKVFHHVLQIDVGIMAIQPGRVHRADDRGGALARAQAAGKQPVVAPDRARSP